jgi:hypothetical protein
LGRTVVLAIDTDVSCNPSITTGTVGTAGAIAIAIMTTTVISVSITVVATAVVAVAVGVAAVTAIVIAIAVAVVTRGSWIRYQKNECQEERREQGA